MHDTTIPNQPSSPAGPSAARATPSPRSSDTGSTPGAASPRGSAAGSAPHGTDHELTLGRGLDVGTANLLSAARTTRGETLCRSERNAFLELPSEYTVNKSLLTRLDVPYVSWEKRVYVLGDSSFELANLFAKDVRRPMCDGFLSPHERDAIPMLRFILERLLGQPTEPGEPVHFCVPAPSIDRDNDTVYHEGIVSGLVGKLGFTPRAMNEAHAIVFSELEGQDFTGIAVSCGGGMFNVCVAYKTIPVLAFSVSRGGDWIDEHVAKVMGVTRARATAIKEHQTDLRRPASREEEAVSLYYRSLVEYVLTNLQERFATARDVPRFTQPVEVVVAGGTSLAGGFTEVFAEELRKIELPFEVSRVRRAEDPFTSVVRGCLIGAQLGDG